MTSTMLARLRISESAAVCSADLIHGSTRTLTVSDLLVAIRYPVRKVLAKRKHSLTDTRLGLQANFAHAKAQEMSLWLGLERIN
jgi:hypothetical protein